MKIPIYIVDAFTDKVFKGNPAAICYLEYWIDDTTMQNIAMENNLSETAFVVKNNGFYELRWFTPEYEIDLCGHATLASAYIIFKYYDKNCNEVIFKTKSGTLKVKKKDDFYNMTFPIREGKKIDIDETLIEALGVIPLEVYLSRDLMIVLQSEDDIRYLQPNLEILKTLRIDGIIVTSKGREVDFVSRFFVPNSVITEDPVTGSAHCTLVPYWSKRLNKKVLKSLQLSKRTGYLECAIDEDNVYISGKATEYLKGEINI